ncbi:thiolase family protein [Bacillus sp. FJAT-45037]|uniref:thiolase family protein n=1 Tax=Bacillus sp. FJAT-45037 TaxID=2011007 RepID=UPI000C239128|nr:thiolase family protein [Bacillus sp. FJAT-45037]
MRDVVIVEAVRTPLAKRKGAFSEVRADELLALPLKEIINRTKIDAREIEDVIVGCVSQVGEQAADVGRAAALIAGYPIEVPGVTIDRQCGSSQQAVHFAAQAIASGDMEVVVAAGVEHMTRVPMFSNMQGVSYSEKLSDQYEMLHQGVSAERMVEKWELSKSELDQFALSSHRKAIQAWKEGRFDREVMPIEYTTPDGHLISLTKDEGPREDTTLEALQSLKTVFKEDGTITAGNASQMSDGAAAILLMSREKAEQLGLKPRCRILARSVVGSDPTLMLTGPIPATEKVLQKANLTMKDMDVYEVNEAFAPVPLIWAKEVGADLSKLNPNGGAIALGHPLGASGARLMVTMLHELERTNQRYGLQAICEGFGMANATIIERIE